MTYRATFLGMKGFTRLESDRERFVWNPQSKQNVYTGVFGGGPAQSVLGGRDILHYIIYIYIYKLYIFPN